MIGHPRSRRTATARQLINHLKRGDHIFPGSVKRYYRMYGFKALLAMHLEDHDDIDDWNDRHA